MTPPLAILKPPVTMLIPERDYRDVAEAFAGQFSVPANLESHLRGVLHDTLASPGSLVRAQIAFSLMVSRGVNRSRALSVGTAIEYFHTASLLFDDLPGMDNATQRRGRPCAHMVHGEAAAQLGGLGLITRAYALLWQVISPLDRARRQHASELVESCLGVGGILNGQSHDLHFRESSRTASDALDAARGKTVTLIRLTLSLPALIAGADAFVLARLDALAESWGLAYQVLDDFKDRLLSTEESGKSNGRDLLLGRPNYVTAAGITPARMRLMEWLDAGANTLDELARTGWICPALVELQSQLVCEARRMDDRLAMSA